MNLERTIVPPIKCQGIKTKLTPWIRSAMPPNFEGRWIEPFMGSGAVAFNVRAKQALLADSNPHIIRFYQAVSDRQITPDSVRRFLKEEGEELRRSEGERYYAVRERFNQHGDPLDFLFLNRACFNGLMRFNRKGQFNVPFCRKPNRFSQAYITKIANQVQAVSNLTALGAYDFRCQNFTATIEAAQKDDFLYCDPPYIARHADYFSGWDETNERQLARSLSKAPCGFILSTWHSNRFRKNPYIERLWAQFHLQTMRHFYHLGAREKNRNAMIEALITNYEPQPYEPPRKTDRQQRLFEKQTDET